MVHAIILLLVFSLFVGILFSKDKIGVLFRRGLLLLILIIGILVAFEYFVWGPKREKEKVERRKEEINRKLKALGLPTIDSNRNINIRDSSGNYINF